MGIQAETLVSSRERRKLGKMLRLTPLVNLTIEDGRRLPHNKSDALINQDFKNLKFFH